MTSPSTQKSDPDVQAAIAILDENHDFLQQHVTTVTNLAQEVEANFQTSAASGPSASATFQNKVNEWLDTANKVIGQFATLSDDLKGASNAMDTGADNATSSAGSWSGDASNAMFSALTPAAPSVAG